MNANLVGHVAGVGMISGFDENYFDLLSAAPGNSGLYVGQVGDPRTFGVTLRISVK